MHGFTQYTPTRIIFGKATQKQAGELAKRFGATKVFVVYGGGSVVRSGLLDQVTASLQEAGLDYMTIGGVKPNPRLSFAREAVKKSIEFGTDFVLAVGLILQRLLHMEPPIQRQISGNSGLRSRRLRNLFQSELYLHWRQPEVRQVIQQFLRMRILRSNEDFLQILIVRHLRS